jgi:2'-5' RNA ligase
MTTLRTFVAVEIPGEVRSSSLRLMERLRGSQAKVTWTKAANLHFSVKFLGDVPANQTAEICSAVQEAVAPFSPFEAVVHSAGAFPSISRPRTLWLGMREGVEQLELVFHAIERLLTPLGFAREHRRYTPHMTLGRVREGSGASSLKELAELLRKYADFDAGAMTVNGVTIFSSTLSSEGPTYQALSHADFRG